MKKTVILIAAVLTVLLLAGCAQQQNQPPANSGGNDSGGNAPPEDNGQAGGEPGSPIFGDFAAKFQSLKFKADYDVTSSASPETMKLTEFIGFGKFRMDLTAQGTETRFYSPEGVTCINQAGQWACFNLPQQQTPPSEQVAGIVEAPADYDTTYDGTMTVAGTTGQCFLIVKKSDPSVKTRACFSGEGALLYSKTDTPQGSSTITATSFSTSISESDFTPPAEPQGLQ